MTRKHKHEDYIKKTNFIGFGTFFGGVLLLIKLSKYLGSITLNNTFLEGIGIDAIVFFIAILMLIGYIWMRD